ncbi:hypothetical protein ACWEJ6_49560 [Nonomuraea sp. NPDC004702]
MLDESGQEKNGTATAGGERQDRGCAGGIDRPEAEGGINAVYLAYVRAGAGHTLIGVRQWIPAKRISDPVTAITTGLPLELAFATQGELASDLLGEAYADDVRLDFVTGDEVYGARTRPRAFPENGQAYVPRVRATFAPILDAGSCLTREQAVTKHLRRKRRWTIHSAGHGSKGERTDAWAWIATTSPLNSCWSASTAPPASWPFTTASRPPASRPPWTL